MKLKKYWWLGILALLGMLVICTQALASDPVGSWVDKQAMFTARSHVHAMGVGGRLYVAGGKTGAAVSGKLEVYNPKTNTWVNKAAMDTAVWGGAVGLISGKIYVVGGYTDLVPNATTTVQIYSPGSNSWSTDATDPLPAATASRAAAVIGKKLYILTDNGAGKKRLRVYDSEADDGSRWSVIDDAASTFYSNQSLQAVQGKLYAFGGDSGGAAISTVEVINPADTTPVWSAFGALPALIARTELGGGVINDKIFAVGGRTNPAANACSGETEVCNPLTTDTTSDGWKARDPLNTARRALGVAVLDGKLYAVGGLDSDAAVSKKLEVFTPWRVTVNVLAPLQHKTVGETGGTGWSVTLRLIYYNMTVAETGVDPYVKVAADGSSVANAKLPGLMVAIPVGSDPVPNLANRFNVVAINNVSSSQVEVLATWLVEDASILVSGANVTIYAAVVDDNAAPDSITDADFDGFLDAEFKALGLASNLAKISFYINP